MVKLGLVLVLMSACALPYVKPQPRTPEVAQRAVAKLELVCQHDGIVYRDPVVFTGVVISERHILTAGHAVVCPVLPKIRATLSDGSVQRLYVERDEYSFGDGRDIARLKLNSAGGFGLHIPPPELASGRGVAVAWLHGIRVSGMFVGTTVAVAGGKPGDSGAGMYDADGRLIGLVTGGGKSHMNIQSVDTSWLEGM